MNDYAFAFTLGSRGVLVVDHTEAKNIFDKGKCATLMGMYEKDGLNDKGRENRSPEARV